MTNEALDLVPATCVLCSRRSVQVSTTFTVDRRIGRVGHDKRWIHALHVHHPRADLLDSLLHLVLRHATMVGLITLWGLLVLTLCRQPISLIHTLAKHRGTDRLPATALYQLSKQSVHTQKRTSSSFSTTEDPDQP
jgi:hypothetical protein